MPTFEERKDKDGNVVAHRVKIRLKGYPPETATFKLLTHAQKWAKITEGNMLQGKHFPTAKAKKHTVSDLIDRYLLSLKVKNLRRHDEVSPLLAWWKSEIGHYLLSHIESETLEEAQHKLLNRVRPGTKKLLDGSPAKISPATVNRYRVALHTAFKYGVKPLKWINTNPVDDVEKLREPEGRVRYLSGEETKALLGACKTSNHPYLLTLVMVGLGTGARRSEMETIRWSHVNSDCTEVTLTKTKNKQTRILHLTGKVSKLIWQLRENKNLNDEYVFQALDGSAKPAIFQHAWLTALKRAKIEDFRFHDLRHTHASYLAMGGASTILIAEVLGHKGLEMVRRYVHLCPTHTAAVVGTTTERLLSNVEV